MWLARHCARFRRGQVAREREGGVGFSHHHGREDGSLPANGRTSFLCVWSVAFLASVAYPMSVKAATLIVPQLINPSQIFVDGRPPRWMALHTDEEGDGGLKKVTPGQSRAR